MSGLAYDAWDGPQAWHDEAEHGQYVPAEGAEVYVDGTLLGVVAAPRAEPVLLYLDLSTATWWQRRTEDAPWFRQDEPSPIYDALLDEWPDHLQRLREERLRASMAGVGRAFRQMAGLITAMGEGLREGS